MALTYFINSSPLFTVIIILHYSLSQFNQLNPIKQFNKAMKSINFLIDGMELLID